MPPVSHLPIEQEVVGLLKYIKGLEDDAKIPLAKELYSTDGSDESLGLDSLDALELTLALENRFGLSLPEDINYGDFRVVGDIVQYIAAKLEGAKNA